MKVTLTTLFCMLCILISIGQVSIALPSSTPDISSMLDVKSTTKGMLIPRMKKIDRDAIVSPAKSLLIYQNDASPGFYFNSGSPSVPAWQALATTSNINGYKIPIDTLPFVINNSGSYIVTKHLKGKNGITINASDVNIDLNFFSVNADVGALTSGINVTGVNSNMTVYNGNISGWPIDGISAAAASNCRFLNVTVKLNVGDGIVAGIGSVFSNCIAFDNGLDGLDGDISAVVTNCVAYDNGDNGIEIDNGSSAQNNTSYKNTGHGFRTLDNCVLANNACYQNFKNGFQTGIGNKVTNNTSNENVLSGFYLGNASTAEGNVARVNAKHGFECNQDVTARNNSADSNTESGFDSSFNGGKFENNNSTDNKNGFVITGVDWIVTKNTASGNTVTQYSIGASNTVATIVTSATINANTNPYANISF